MLARRPLRGRTGSTLLVVVAAFGVSMIVFGLSHDFALSVAALAVSGFVDMISVNIRCDDRRRSPRRTSSAGA